MRREPRDTLTQREEFILKQLQHSGKLYAFLRLHRRRVFDNKFQRLDVGAERVEDIVNLPGRTAYKSMLVSSTAFKAKTVGLRMVMSELIRLERWIARRYAEESNQQPLDEHLDKPQQIVQRDLDYLELGAAGASKRVKHEVARDRRVSIAWNEALRQSLRESAGTPAGRRQVHTCKRLGARVRYRGCRSSLSDIRRASAAANMVSTTSSCKQ